MKNIKRYYHTLKYLRREQIVWRIAGKLGIQCGLKNKPQRNINWSEGCFIEELDYDKDFLKRFNVEEILNNHITLLNEVQEFCWEESWNISEKSALWNFNLHYFEYLYPLLYEFEQTGERKYLDKALACMKSWINNNPQKSGGAGWSPYTVSLRLTNWLGFLSRARQYVEQKMEQQIIQSVYEQYVFLTSHLEKHLLGNHYLENLKAIVLCAIAFRDSKVLDEALDLFCEQCEEQILNDGMNFELSPMYHKLIFEDVLRVAIWLQLSGKESAKLEPYIYRMADAAHTLEYGLERIPLFNDAGTNVTKSLRALEVTVEKYFGYKPIMKTCLKEAGYYRFELDGYTLIVDAGKAGPDYIPGHSHCDAMSFEVFYQGVPVIVNCGTYAYQCEDRGFYRSTAAHNTVMINDTEQSECWSNFRLARRSAARVLQIKENSITLEMKDYKGNIVKRHICLEEGYLLVEDWSEGNVLTAWYHGVLSENIITNSKCEHMEQLYAEEFGKRKSIPVMKVMADNYISVNIELKSLRPIKEL